MCFNSNYEDSICMPVLERQNADSKGCLKWPLVYFSLPHRSLDLCSVARCEGGTAGLKSIPGAGGLCSMGLASFPLPRATRSCFCALPLSICDHGTREIWLHFDATCCEVQEQYALRLAAVSYIALVFNIVKPEFPECQSSLNLKQKHTKPRLQCNLTENTKAHAWRWDLLLATQKWSGGCVQRDPLKQSQRASWITLMKDRVDLAQTPFLCNHFSKGESCSNYFNALFGLSVDILLL